MLTKNTATTVAVTAFLMLSAATCFRAKTLPAGCESVLIGAPSVSVMHLADTTRKRLSVAAMTPFPDHTPLAGVQISLYADTIESRVANPLRNGSTDSSGLAELEPLPGGLYGLRARRPGAEPFFGVVRLREASAESLAVRIVTQAQICY